MAKNYNLHCFRCGNEFNSKEDVFRTLDYEPFCWECFNEYLSEDGWDDDFIEAILHDKDCNKNCKFLKNNSCTKRECKFRTEDNFCKICNQKCPFEVEK